jgi:hypothetical protein
MPERVETLFDEYARAFAAGERPQARDYLARAGGKADELGTLIDRFVAAAPAPRPGEVAVALTEAMLGGEPPLVLLRTRQGLRRDQVVDALVAALGLDPRKRLKVERYYEQLETGMLESRRVDLQVWDALGETLRAKLDEIRSWRPARAHFGSLTFGGVEAPAAPPTPMAPAMATARAPADEPDEVDRLFGT